MRPELVLATELLQRDDSNSIEEALRLIQSTVFSFSVKVCGHREDAEDTMQDVLLKSIPYLKKIESPKALAVWLYKVTRNRCWMSRRRSKFAPERTLSLDELLPDSAELESLTLRDPLNAESEVISHQQQERVRKAVLLTPSKYRLILVLHDMEDLDTSEVAKITGLSEGNVRVRLHRARLFLRRQLSSPVRNNSRKPKRKTSKRIDCRKMFAGLSEFIDGRVDDASCEHVQKHLRDCAPCTAFVEDLIKAVQRCKNYEVSCKSATADKLRKLLLQEYLRLSSIPGQTIASL